MTKYKIIPQFRNGCILQGDLELMKDLKEGDTIFLISKKPTKTISVLSRIERLIQGTDYVVYIDRRILGTLEEGDKVSLLKYNPADAITIFLAISNTYTRVFEGDWTSVAKPSLENKVIDIGTEISFLIRWEDEDGTELPPITVSGIISSTIPSPPVKIGLKTKILIQKFPDGKLDLLKEEALLKQKERVKVLEEELKQDGHQKVQSMKQQNYPTKAFKYSFRQSDPRTIFAFMTDIFKGYKSAENPCENLFDDNFLASAVYFTEEIAGSLSIIEIQVVGKEQNGELIIMVTAKDEDTISVIMNKYDPIIHMAKGALEQKAELNVQKCPRCGGDLPMEEIKADGTVSCLYCRSTCKLPKTFRY